jgi:hypothetical protein
MRTPEERPRGGGDWLGHARVYERQRRETLDEAQKAEERGDAKSADELRTYAEGWRRDRDRAQREEERAAMNRSLASRRHYR